MERFPILVTAGAGLLGWIAGELVLSDPLLEGLTAGDSGLIDEAVPALGAALVVATGHIWAGQRRREQAVSVNASTDCSFNLFARRSAAWRQVADSSAH